MYLEFFPTRFELRKVVVDLQTNITTSSEFGNSKLRSRIKFTIMGGSTFLNTRSSDVHVFSLTDWICLLTDPNLQDLELSKHRFSFSVRYEHEIKFSGRYNMVVKQKRKFRTR